MSLNETSAAQERLELGAGTIAIVGDSSVVLERQEKTTYRTQLVSDPPRFIVDLADVRLNYLKRNFPAHSSVSALRTAPHGKFSRVVLDLKGSPVAAPRVAGTLTRIEITIPDKSAGTPAPALSVPEPTLAEESTPPEQIKADTSVPEILKASKVSKAESLEAPVENKEEIILPSEIGLRFSLSDLIITFPYSGRKIKDVTVRNKSDKPLYMTAKADQVINAGKPEEAQMPAKSLLVSPRRFELQPGAERLVRMVVASREEDTEAIYRVNFIPDAEPFEAQEGKPSRIAVSTALAALVIVNPKDPDAVLKTQWKEGALTLTNEGNTNIYLDRGKVCNDSQCVSVPAKRLYSNASWTINAEGIVRAEFLKKVGEDFENLSLKKEVKND